MFSSTQPVPRARPAAAPTPAVAASVPASGCEGCCSFRQASQVPQQQLPLPPPQPSPLWPVHLLCMRTYSAASWGSWERKACAAASPSAVLSVRRPLGLQPGRPRRSGLALRECGGAFLCLGCFLGRSLGRCLGCCLGCCLGHGCCLGCSFGRRLGLCGKSHPLGLEGGVRWLRGQVGDHFFALRQGQHGRLGLVLTTRRSASRPWRRFIGFLIWFYFFKRPSGDQT